MPVLWPGPDPRPGPHKSLRSASCHHFHSTQNNNPSPEGAPARYAVAFYAGKAALEASAKSIQKRNFFSLSIRDIIVHQPRGLLVDLFENTFSSFWRAAFPPSP
jgi:hypothetical protein